MFNQYFEIIERLENLGKFKQADLVEKFVKISQFQVQNRSNLQNPVSPFFGIDSYAQSQIGSFNPLLLTGQQAAQGARQLNFNDYTIAEMSPQEKARMCKTDPEFCMRFKENAINKANSFSQGQSLASLISHLKIIDEVLYVNLGAGVLPAQNTTEYLQRFEGPLVTQISRLVQAEQDVNRLFYGLSNSIAGTKYLKDMREVQAPQTGTIAKGLSDALQNMKPLPGAKNINPLVVQKYNKIVTDPRFKYYIGAMFQPV